ncbi:putative addiction module antidote protein [Rhizobium jaguaris]|uniref:Putative addiction module antidote protein n=1 Tax=Rhizobium jaguaris TaxID=1312183 RepID=A0A387FTX2_9HYPH|nr:addiction module antidote protein [Rhizobium jaguaris]AYG59251.1 putative addiction module antidote protein [Rhizobium jaguaris]
MARETPVSVDAVDGYIAAAFETDDPSSIAKALGEVARTRNMSKLAKDVGMNRSALYRALSGDGNPEFATILKVVKALGLKLTPVLAVEHESDAA